MHLHVSHLSSRITAIDLKVLFGEFGLVRSVELIFNRLTGNSYGYGFVEMASVPDAQNAIAAMNNKDIMGRVITVTERETLTGFSRGRRGRD